MPKLNRTNLVVVIGLLIIACALAIFVLYKPAAAPTSSSSPPITNTTEPDLNGTSITVKGESLCLPHKVDGKIQTAECTIGMKADDGTYYALRDSNADYSLTMKAGSGKRIEVTGTLKESKNSNYKDSGVITMTAVTEL